MSEKFTQTVLPVDFKEQKKFILDNKEKLQELVILYIDNYINSETPIDEEIFVFGDTGYTVTINASSFKQNLQYLLDQYLIEERYELCPRVKSVMESLEKYESKNN